jgi:hypothetical protein
MCGHYRFPWSRVRYQPLGQGHGLSWTVCPTHDLAAQRREIEDKIGGLKDWLPESFTPGRGEDIPTALYRDIPDLGMSSPAQAPAPGAWTLGEAANPAEPARAPPDG